MGSRGRKSYRIELGTSVQIFSPLSKDSFLGFIVGGSWRYPKVASARYVKRCLKKMIVPSGVRVPRSRIVGVHLRGPEERLLGEILLRSGR
jgi:hypothetical protein